MRRMQGFTLLEVMVALLIAATLAVMVNGVLRQRIDTHLAVRERHLATLCARELVARFEVEGYWPQGNRVQGLLRQGAGECHWRLQLGGTGVVNLRRGELAIHADAAANRPIGHFTLFLQRP